MNLPNMNLTLPDPSTSIGPLWAQQLNTAFTGIDNHDHSSGKGLPVTPTGLNINADLTFQSNALLDVKLARFTSQGAVLTGGLNRTQLYVVGGELYYQDASGTNVQVTASGSLNIAGVGGITGLSATTAALTYSDILKTFILTQSSGISAKLDTGRVTIRDEVSSANGVTLKSPSSLGASYTLTLPAALPATSYALTYTSSAGAEAYLSLGSANTVLRVNSAGTALEYAQVGTGWIADAAVTAVKIADANVTTAKIADANVTTPKIADGNVTTAKLASLNRAVSSTISFAVTGNTAVTGSNVTINCVGNRLLIVSLTPNSAAGIFKLSQNGTSANAQATIELYNGSSVVASQVIAMETTGATYPVAYSLPPSSIQFLLLSTAGTTTYTLRVAGSSAGTTTSFFNCFVSAIEL